MDEPEVAVVYSPREWVDRLGRFLVDHGGARIRAKVLDRRDALEEHYDVLVLDDFTHFLSPRCVDELHRMGRRVLGVYDPNELGGNEQLLGRERATPRSAAWTTSSRLPRRRPSSWRRSPLLRRLHGVTSMSSWGPVPDARSTTEAQRSARLGPGGCITVVGSPPGGCGATERSLDSTGLGVQFGARRRVGDVGGRVALVVLPDSKVAKFLELTGATRAFRLAESPDSLAELPFARNRTTGMEPRPCATACLL